MKKAAELPKEKRVLITSHDAFNYFGRAYGFKVVGLQGISTVEEANLAAMTQMVDFVRKEKIKAIFIESSVPPNAIKRISQDAGVKIAWAAAALGCFASHSGPPSSSRLVSGPSASTVISAPGDAPSITMLNNPLCETL